ncbi:hypothetical protein KAR91_71060 [Candidatus Pacearchaeota archaeon]|nr:hypothetical protein [Candidatus Pacearchaeota archaeon]
MKKYTIYLPDNVIKEIDAEVQVLRHNKPEGAPKNIGRGTVIAQAWYKLKQSQQKN